MTKQLPLELEASIAKELGTDVFRLRHEEGLPVDLSSEIILRKAIVDYESHEAWSSIRRPLKEFGKKNYSKELQEREALYWSHQRGCPKRLIASGLAAGNEDDDRWQTSHLRPSIRHGYLIYSMKEVIVETDDPVHYIVVDDLVRKLRWRIEGHFEQAQVTVMNAKIIVANYLESEKTRLSEVHIGNDHQPRDLDLWDHEVLLEYPNNGNERVDMIVACEDVILLLCQSPATTLRLCKDGACKVIATFSDSLSRHSNAIEVQGSTFLFAHADREREVLVRRYSKHGMLLETKQLSFPGYEREYELTLKDAGIGWHVAALGERSGNYFLSEEGTATIRNIAAIWKNRLYVEQETKTDVEVRTWDGYDSKYESRVLGTLRLISADTGYTMWDIVASDSFLLVVLRKVDWASFKWFVFTFDDLPGLDVTTEAVMEGYHWIPVDQAEATSWSKWHG